MKNRLFFLLVFGISVVKVFGQDAASLGNFYLDEMQIGKARAFFKDKMKSNPNDQALLFGLGNVYLSTGAIDSAKQVYQQAQSLDPKNPFALVGLGKIAMLKGDAVAENDFFERARKADKKNPEVFTAIVEGCINLSKQDTATASKYLNMGLELNSKYAPLHIATGDFEKQKKAFGKAANAYDRAIFFDPKCAEAYYKLGLIHALSRSNRDALNAYDKAIELNPDQILVYKYRGDLFYSIGRYVEAEKSYTTYMAKAEATWDDKERFAIILFFNKKYNEAGNLMESVIAKGSDASVLLRIQGYIAYETGEYAKGLDYMNRFFKTHNPERFIASDFTYYAKFQQKDGKDSLAIENYKKAIAMDSTKTDIYDELAKLYVKNKKHVEAAAYYRKMMENGADKLGTNFLIGKEYYFEGDIWRARFDSLMSQQKKNNIPFPDSTIVREKMRMYFIKADSAFTKVTELNPQYAGGFIWKGRMQANLDPEAETPLAKDAYEKALSILVAGDPAKSKKPMIECYRFLGSYYFLGSERNVKADPALSNEMKVKSVDYFTKILEIDPADAQATDVLNNIKEREKASKKKK